MDNFGNLMKEAKKMQERMEKAQEELKELVVTGTAGGGMVEMKVNGRHDVLAVKINPALLEDDVKVLEDLVKAAANSANAKVEEKSKEKIAVLTQGIELPDFMKSDDDKK